MSYKKKILDKGIPKDKLKSYIKKFNKIEELKEYYYKCAYDFLYEGGPLECLEEYSPIFTFKRSKKGNVIIDKKNSLKYYSNIILNNDEGIIIPFHYFETFFNLRYKCFNYREKNRYVRDLDELTESSINIESESSKSSDSDYMEFSVLKIKNPLSKEKYKIVESYITKLILQRPLLIKYSNNVKYINGKISIMTKLLDGIGDAINICNLANYLVTQNLKIELIIVGYLPQEKCDNTNKMVVYKQNIKLRCDKFYDMVYDNPDTETINKNMFFNGKNKNDFRIINDMVKDKDNITMHYYECPEHLMLKFEISDLDMYVNDTEHISLYERFMKLPKKTAEKFYYSELLIKRRMPKDYINMFPVITWNDPDVISIFYGPKLEDTDMDLMEIILNDQWKKKYIYITEYGKINNIFNWITANGILLNETDDDIINYNNNFNIQFIYDHIETDSGNIINKYSTGLLIQDIGMMLKEIPVTENARELFLINTDMYKNDFMYFFYCYSHSISHIVAFIELINNNYPKDQKKLIRIHGQRTKQYLNKFEITITSFDMGKYAKKCDIYKHSEIENVYLCNAYFNNIDELFSVSEDIVACTGDNSISEVISYKKLPFYEVKATKIDFIISLIILAHTYQLKNYYNFLQCSFNMNIFFDVLNKKYLPDDVFETKHKYKYYDPKYSFDKDLALEEAVKIYEIINNSFNFKKTILGIIARENMSKEFDILTDENKYTMNFNDYLCAGDLTKNYTIL